MWLEQNCCGKCQRPNDTNCNACDTCADAYKGIFRRTRNVGVCLIGSFLRSV